MRISALLCGALLVGACKTPQEDEVARINVIRKPTARALAVKLKISEGDGTTTPSTETVCLAFSDLSADASAGSPSDGGRPRVTFDLRKGPWTAPTVEALAFTEPGCGTALANENNTLKKVIFAKAGMGDELDIEIGPKSDQDKDDDGDGATRRDDCDDNDATVYSGATEVCSDDKDNNCNSLIDCTDPACQSSLAQCAASEPNSRCDTNASGGWYCRTTQERCADNVDNNGNNKVDCEDPDCKPGDSCSDGDACTLNDKCQGGNCASGLKNECVEPQGQCTKPKGTCDKVTGKCTYDNQPPTFACDGGPCTTGSRCDGKGVCNVVNDCAVVSVCRAGSCSPNNACSFSDVPDPIACPNEGDTGFCSAGVCKPLFVNSSVDEPIGVGVPAEDLLIPEGCTMTVDTRDFGMTGTVAPQFAGASCKAPAGGVDIAQVQYLKGVTDPRQYLVLIRAKSISISGKIEVKGRRPLTLFSSGNMTLSSTGIIDARGASEPLPVDQRNKAYCQSTGDGSSNKNAVAGGSGGSFNGVGGLGGGANATGGNISAPGASTASSNALVTGCPGGNGGGATTGAATGNGGSGGGAVQLFSRRTLQVDGRIYAFGAGGKAGSNANKIGGGGGGSGGFIALDAPVINIGAAAKLIAIGGGGGAGDSNPGLSSSAEDGTAPTGGASASGNIGAGGNGAGSVAGLDSVALGGGTASAVGPTNIATAGGGGGALGVVQVNATKCTKPILGPTIAPTQRLYSGSAACAP